MATTPVLLSRYTQDLGFDTRGLARYVGNLEEGRSKVSVNSALSIGDRWDHYRFRVTTDQFVRLRTGELVGKDGEGKDVAGEGTVRYQLLSPSGQIVADSDRNAGAAHDAWLDLTSDTNLRMVKGSYTLRVARGNAAASTKEYIYSLTFRSNDSAITETTEESAFREFLTTERPAVDGASFDQYANITAVLGLFTDVVVI